MLNNYGIIYKATSPTGKVYIGQTTQPFEDRKKTHRNSKMKTLFNSAIKKHGFDNFTWEILETCENKIALDLAEIKWIDFYNSTDKRYGYNMKEGGAYGKHCEEARKKNSQSHTGIFDGEKNPFFGKKHTKESIEKMKAAHKGHIPWNKGLSGVYTTKAKGTRCIPEDVRKKISESLKGRKIAPEVVQKLALIRRGRHVSAETREKMRLAQLGKKASPEARKAMSEAQKRRFQKERAEIA